MKKFRKAYTAAGAAFATALGTGFLDGSVTGSEFIAAVGAGLLAGAAVYKIKNKD